MGNNTDSDVFELLLYTTVLICWPWEYITVNPTLYDVSETFSKLSKKKLIYMWMVRLVIKVSYKHDFFCLYTSVFLDVCLQITSKYE